MSAIPIVAVVGRPNIGKSTLVNRILHKKAAVVDEQPGVTRDRREFIAEWNDREFVLVDTGGWELSPDESLTMGIKAQAEAALEAADLVIFVANAKSAISDDDVGIARLLQRSEVPYMFIANKVDGPKDEMSLDHLWTLGLGEPVTVSALHGRGMGDMLDELVAALPPDRTDEAEDDVEAHLAIIGRPNVGKSTLLNQLVGEERVLVSATAGTTRDPIDAVVDLDGERYRIIDTAGLRRRTKVKDDVEFYAMLRAHDVLGRADVALLIIDGTEGATHQEQRLAEEIMSAGVGLIVVLNKWDVITEEEREVTEDSVADRLAFVGWAPVIRASAKTGARLKRLPEAIRLVLANRRMRIPTPELNRLIRKLQQAHPPPVRKGKRARIIYAVQAETEPPTIVLFLRGGDLGEGYLRFIEGRLRKEFDFTGTPIRFRTRRRHKAYDPSEAGAST